MKESVRAGAAAVSEGGYLRSGTSTFRRANLSLFLAGRVTFAILYSTQPLLPVFSADFHLAPAWASISLSASTLTLAITLVVAGVPLLFMLGPHTTRVT